MQNPADESGVCKSTGVERRDTAYDPSDVGRLSVTETATGRNQNRFLVLILNRQGGRRFAPAGLLNIKLPQVWDGDNTAMLRGGRMRVDFRGKSSFRKKFTNSSVKVRARQVGNLPHEGV